MNNNIVNIETWIKAVERIGFEKALVLILLFILFMALIWILHSHGGKLSSINDGVCGLDHKFEKMLAIEQVKAEIRDDRTTDKIKNIVEGPATEKSCLVDLNQERAEKRRVKA